jgi:hypothetical protein
MINVINNWCIAVVIASLFRQLINLWCRQEVKNFVVVVVNGMMAGLHHKDWSFFCRQYHYY